MVSLFAPNCSSWLHAILCAHQPLIVGVDWNNMRDSGACPSAVPSACGCHLIDSKVYERDPLSSTVGAHILPPSRHHERGNSPIFSGVHACRSQPNRAWLVLSTGIVEHF